MIIPSMLVCAASRRMKSINPFRNASALPFRSIFSGSNKNILSATAGSFCAFDVPLHMPQSQHPYIVLQSCIFGQSNFPKKNFLPSNSLLLTAYCAAKLANSRRSARRWRIILVAQSATCNRPIFVWTISCSGLLELRNYSTPLDS